MITYDDLVRPLSEGGHYEMFRGTLHTFLGLLQPEDRALLYQCHMMDSSNCGQAALVLSGPGRTFDDPDNPPKRIGSLPSNFKEFEGEADIDSIRKGMDDYEPISLAKCQAITDNPELGEQLWGVYRDNNEGYPHSSIAKEMAGLKKLGLVRYNKSYKGWYLTAQAWNLLEA